MNIITADQVQKGDKIRVTNTEDGEHRKVSYSYEGVAAKQSGEVWRTEDGGNLWVREKGAVIELLDRPNPLPTLPSAIVQYTVDFDLSHPHRTAVRQANGTWIVYRSDGEQQDQHHSNKVFHAWLTRSGFDFDIVFAGVAK